MSVLWPSTPQPHDTRSTVLVSWGCMAAWRLRVPVPQCVLDMRLACVGSLPDGGGEREESGSRVGGELLLIAANFQSVLLGGGGHFLSRMELLLCALRWQNLVAKWSEIEVGI